MNDIKEKPDPRRLIPQTARTSCFMGSQLFRYTHPFLLLVLSLLLLAHLSACSPDGNKAFADQALPQETDPKEKDKEKPSVLVKATNLTRGPIRSFIEVSADIQSLNKVDMYPYLSGIQIMEICAEEGDFIKKGDILARLDSAEIELELAQAKVNHQESVHKLEKARIAVKEALEREKKARIQAEKSKSDYEKSKNMFQNELISEDEFAVDRLTWEQFVSELDLTLLQKEQADLDLQLAGTESDRCRIAVNNASIKLSRTEIKAPFNGYITFRGAMLGMAVSTGTHLFTLVDRDILIANLFIPQESLMKVKVGMNIEFLCDALPGTSFLGSISIINPVVDPTTGTVKLRAQLNSDPEQLLRPGMFITTKIITASRDNALLVPRKAVFYDDEKPTFFIVEPPDMVKKIHFEPTEAATATSLEIGSLLTPGAEIDEGTQIIIVGQDNLKDGDKVRIVDEIS
ncbi:MAG: efflux RND transporter periplasmic adaptor subunit [Planctomycetota bacterium]